MQMPLKLGLKDIFKDLYNSLDATRHLLTPDGARNLAINGLGNPKAFKEDLKRMSSL